MIDGDLMDAITHAVATLDRIADALDRAFPPSPAKGKMTVGLAQYNHVDAQTEQLRRYKEEIETAPADR